MWRSSPFFSFDGQKWCFREDTPPLATPLLVQSMGKFIINSTLLVLFPCVKQPTATSWSPIDRNIHSFAHQQ